MTFKDQVAVITGAGRLNGVGAATAKLLAKEGCHILINCIKNKEQALNVLELCKQEGVDAELFMGDLTSSSVCGDLAQVVQARWGRVDMLINCLGTTKTASYEKLDQLNEDDFSRLFAVNATAPFLMVQALQSLLKKSDDAVVINVSSTAGLTGKSSSIAYAAAKGAENTLTLALAQALAPHIRVNAVCPGFIDSSWWEEAFFGTEEQYATFLNTMKQASPLNKVLKPDDVAMTILSVIKNRAMTGELVRVDTGTHLGNARISLPEKR